MLSSSSALTPLSSSSALTLLSSSSALTPLCREAAIVTCSRPLVDFLLQSRYTGMIESRQSRLRARSLDLDQIFFICNMSTQSVIYIKYS